MPVPDGEEVLVVQLDLTLVLNDRTIELCVVGPGESDNEDLNKVFERLSSEIIVIKETYRIVLHLHPQLGVLLADDGQLDPDVASLSPAQQTLLKRENYDFRLHKKETD